MKKRWFIASFAILMVICSGCNKNNPDTDHQVEVVQGELIGQEDVEENLELEENYFSEFSEATAYATQKTALMAEVFEKHGFEHEITPDYMATYIKIIREDKYFTGEKTNFILNYAVLPDFYNGIGVESFQGQSVFSNGIESIINEPQFKTLVDALNVATNLTYTYEDIGNIISENYQESKVVIDLDGNPDYSMMVYNQFGMMGISYDVIRPFSTKIHENNPLEMDTIEEFVNFEKIGKDIDVLAKKYKMEDSNSEEERVHAGKYHASLRSISNERSDMLNIYVDNNTANNNGDFSYKVHLSFNLGDKSSVEEGQEERTDKYLAAIVIDILDIFNVDHGLDVDSFVAYLKSGKHYKFSKEVDYSGDGNSRSYGGFEKSDYYPLPFSSPTHYRTEGDFHFIQYILSDIIVPVKVAGKTKQTF